jgi:hypothetical protein
MDLTEARSLLGQVRDAIPTGQWGANVTTAVQRALAELRLLNPLVEHFRGEVNRRDGLGLDIRGVTREAMAIVEGDDWPGNVRELEAVVKRAMVCRRAGSGRGVRYVPATRTP